MAALIVLSLAACGVYYTEDGDRGAYLASLDDSAFILITTANKKNIEAVAARFSLALN